jgi:hypothetical protein
MVSRTMPGEVSQVSGNPSGRTDAYHQEQSEEESKQLLEEERTGERSSVEQENSTRYGATVIRAGTEPEKSGFTVYRG